MRYLVLAADYDGTLAHHGQIDNATREALHRLKESGRKLVMVTGRELDELLDVCPEIGLFDLVVAENGALVYDPHRREEIPLARRPPESFLATLRERGVEPMSVGRVIVATWEPHERTVLDVIHEHGLELQVIFNKKAVMVLPSGVNKAAGLRKALDMLKMSPRNVVAVGDAENDHALFQSTECAVAVANAVPSLHVDSDWVTTGARGEGVAELIDRLIKDDLASLAPRLVRHHIPLGRDRIGREFRFPPYGQNVLIAGTSGSGKSTMTTGVLERLDERGYQFCIIDPEGDYSTFPNAFILGGPNTAPTIDEVIDVLGHPEADIVVNLIGLSLDHRPEFFDALMPRLQEMRGRSGRPHWLVIDEAHHLLPRSRDPTTLPRDLNNTMFITVHPESMAPSVLETVDQVWAVGDEPLRTLRAFGEVVGDDVPAVEPINLSSGQSLVWPRRPSSRPPLVIRTIPPRSERRRHSRKYAEGQLTPEQSFYFRGPADRMKLRAQNLGIFLQLAEGIDDETWLFHLQQNDYADWFRTVIKDRELAAEAEEIARRFSDEPQRSREAIREAIVRRFVLPE